MNTAARIRVLIADDEEPARKRLLQFLADEPDVSVIAECRDGRQAYLEIERQAPDLAFLDVEMPELNGFDVVAQIGSARMPITVFATAYDHYALSAFEANALDYLLKPFDRDRFARAMAKARERIRMGQLTEAQNQLAAVLSGLGAEKKHQNRILVKAGESHEFVKAADILYITAEGNYVRLHTLNGSHLLRERMIGIMERLDPALFRRVHRSHIVNLDHITKLLPWFGGDHLVMMADGSRLTLTRNYRDMLKEFL